MVDFIESNFDREFLVVLTELWNVEHLGEAPPSEQGILRETLDCDPDRHVTTTDYTELKRMGILGDSGQPTITIDQFFRFAEQMNHQYALGLVVERAGNQKIISGPDVPIDSLMTTDRVIWPRDFPDDQLRQAALFLIEEWNIENFQHATAMTPVIAQIFDPIRPGISISPEDYEQLRINASFGEPDAPQVPMSDFFRLARYLKDQKNYSHLPPVGVTDFTTSHPPKTSDFPEPVTRQHVDDTPITQIQAALSILREKENAATRESQVFSQKPASLERMLACNDLIFNNLEEMALKKTDIFNGSDLLKIRKLAPEGSSARNYVRLFNERVDDCLETDEQDQERAIIQQATALLAEKEESAPRAMLCAQYHFPYWLGTAYLLSHFSFTDFDSIAQGQTPDCSKIRLKR